MRNVLRVSSGIESHIGARQSNCPLVVGAFRSARFSAAVRQNLDTSEATSAGKFVVFRAGEA